MREHQQIAVEKCLHRERGIIQHPTGSGKTITFANLIACLNKRTIVIVPNRLLLDQTYNQLCRCLSRVTIGRVGHKWFEPEADVVVATAAKALRERDKVGSWGFEVLIVDECHHVNDRQHIWGNWTEGNGWYDLALAIPAYYRFAFSGTVPKSGTLNRMALEAVTDIMIDSITPSESIEAGTISDVQIEMIKLPRKPKLSWVDAKENYLIRGMLRNELIRDEAVQYFSDGKSVLIFVDRIEHGEILEEMIPNSIFVQGESNSDKRDQAVRLLKGKQQIVIGTIFGEGFDLPNLDVAINACGGKSTTKLAQQVGRVLRKEEGKEKGLLIDFFDQDGEGCLTRHSRARRRVYEKLYGKVQIRELSVQQ